MLTAGTKLGPYEILAAIGAGGMGEVYRARDTRLERTVAVKVLATHLSSNPDLRQRFEREARAISSLSHGNICHLYDVGHQDGIDYLVMEYVEGETLADRLRRGPLAPEQVLKLGIELADALEKAHRAGFVHRDIKPGNVMLTKSGAKLLDFGLARTSGRAVAAAGSSAVATMTSAKPLTQEGTLVGTYQYMAPEQIEGGEADARTDIFALGVLLYEAATGRMPFPGKTQASVIAAILASDPPLMSSLQPLTPVGLERVVRTCLAKDSDDRIQTAHDVKLDLEWVRDSGQQQAPTVRARRGRDLWWTAAVVILLAGAIVAMLVKARPAPAVLRFSVLPPGGNPERVASGFPALSPDGKDVALLGADSRGVLVLWVRALSSAEAKALPETDRATFPFWSPDGRQIAFFADRKLKKIGLDGGRPEFVADVSSGRGGSWSRAGTIIFAPGLNSPIMRVSASGGEVQPVTDLDASRGEISHRFPSFLPDGKHFLYFIRATSDDVSGVYVGTLGSREKRRILRDSSNAIFANGYLLFVRGEELFAQPFDSKALALTGEPRQLATGVSYIRAYDGAEISASAAGTVVFGPEYAPFSRLVWLDRSGAEVGGVGQPGYLRSPRISPDGSRIAYMRFDPRTNDGDMWLYDLRRNSDARLTYQPMWYAPVVWSPKGDQLAYTGNRKGSWSIFVRDLGSDKERELPKPGETASYSRPTSWSPDGQYIAYQNSDPKRAWDMWIVPTDGGKPFPFVATEFSETDGEFSPDGKWLAYVSDEGGAPDVYIRSFPGAGAKVRISNSGGGRPKWRQDGKELLYVDRDDNVMSVDLSGGPERASAPRKLFRLTNLVGDVLASTALDFSTDGNRFLVQESVKSDYIPRVEVIVNWPEELKK